MPQICFLVSILLCIALIPSTTLAHTVGNQELITLELEKATSAYSKALKNADADAILNAIPQIINSLTAKKS